MNRALILTLAWILYANSFLSAQTAVEPSYFQEIPGTPLKFEMKSIPSGSFVMGSLDGKSDEQPPHEVHLDGFWMGAHEITWDLYELFLYKEFEERLQENQLGEDLAALTRPTKPYIDMTYGMGKRNKPAIGMTQYNAIQFCKWLYLKTGVFFRLPTEAEWEYASRAEATTAFYFGDQENELSDYAWFKKNSQGKTQEVGQKKPNAWGLYDMYGNVSEWTYDQYQADFYKNQADRPVLNPVNEPKQLYPMVVRGGSYLDEAKSLRSSARAASDPYWKQLDPQIPKSNWWFTDAPFVGFRIVRPFKQPSEQEIWDYYNRKPIADY